MSLFYPLMKTLDAICEIPISPEPRETRTESQSSICATWALAVPTGDRRTCPYQLPSNTFGATTERSLWPLPSLGINGNVPSAPPGVVLVQL